MGNLIFDEKNYVVETKEMEGKSLEYRAFRDISYCEKPVDRVQKCNIFVPEKYYQGESINGYTLHTAPIFMPNTVGGYMEGPVDEPGKDFMGRTNSVFLALLHGYVVVTPGIRGRNTGKKTNEFFVGGKAKESQEEAGKFVGRAPALIVDHKAVVRYLKFNKERIPGNADRIITNGTSAGGALSAMAGAMGNLPQYETYLKEIGAAEGDDSVFASSCYCPIHNLEHADEAYEWLFHKEKEFHKMVFQAVDGKVQPKMIEGEQGPEAMEMAKELANLFPAYVNGLQLKDVDGNPLTLDEQGEGSFKNWVKHFLLLSAQKEKETHDSMNRLSKLMVPGSAIDMQEYLVEENGSYVDLDWDAFVNKITRMKTTPAFDDLHMDSPECEEFGDAEVFARHFTAFAAEHDDQGGELASAELISLLNPTLYVDNPSIAKHWRIRHGAFDRDTSLAIPVILATLLQNHGVDVDFALPWGLPHSGDYDLEELFAWIDRLCK